MMDHDRATPESYAKRLAGYIRDPSTIRVRTLEQFGRAPTLERISAYQKQSRGRVTAHSGKLSHKFDPSPEEWQPKEELPKVATPEPEPADAPVVFSLPPWKQPAYDAVAVITVVAGSFGLSYGEIIGQNRAQYIVRVRSLIATLLCERGNSTPQVGRWMRRDHSTIVHARHMLPIYAQRSPTIARAYDHFRKEWGIGE